MQLAALLRDADQDVRSCAHKALKCVDAPPGRVAAQLLQDERDGVRVWVTCCLSAGVCDCRPFHGEVAGALKDNDAEVRQNIAKALGRTGSGAAPYVPALAALLQDASDDVRYWSAWAIGKTGNAAAAAHAALLAVLHTDPCSHVRRCAATALVLAKPIEMSDSAAAFNAVEALAALSSSSLVDNRRCAAWALGEIGEAALQQQTEAIADLLGDEDAGVRRCAAEALGKVGPKAISVLHLLKGLLEDPNADVRYWSQWSVSRLDRSSSQVELVE